MSAAGLAHEPDCGNVSVMVSRSIPLASAAVAFALACASPARQAVAPPAATCPPISDLNPVRDTMRVSNAYFAWQTSRMAAVKSRPPLPYPGKSGNVMAWVVVDTAGQAELATLHFEGQPDPALADAVRAFLAEAEFEAAQIGPGCRVRMWARMPFEFRP